MSKDRQEAVMSLPPLCNHLINSATLFAGLRTRGWRQWSCMETPHQEGLCTGLSLMHFAGPDCCCHCHSFAASSSSSTPNTSPLLQSLLLTNLAAKRWQSRATVAPRGWASRHKDSGSPCLWFAGEDLHHSACSPSIPHPPPTQPPLHPPPFRVQPDGRNHRSEIWAGECEEAWSALETRPIVNICNPGFESRDWN